VIIIAYLFPFITFGCCCQRIFFSNQKSKCERGELIMLKGYGKEKKTNAKCASIANKNFFQQRKTASVFNGGKSFNSVYFFCPRFFPLFNDFDIFLLLLFRGLRRGFLRCLFHRSLFFSFTLKHSTKR
jgi:hypothetical protein